MDFSQFPDGTEELVAAILEWDAEEYGGPKRGGNDCVVSPSEFTRAEMTDETSLSSEQVRYRLEKLLEMGYVKRYRRPSERGSREKIYLITSTLRSEIDEQSMSEEHTTSNVRAREIHEVVSRIAVLRNEIEELRLRAGLPPEKSGDR